MIQRIYRTSDDKIFDTFDEAEEHENALDQRKWVIREIDDILNGVFPNMPGTERGVLAGTLFERLRTFVTFKEPPK